MADVIGVVVASGVAAGSAAAMSGMPPRDVVVWSVIGGLVSIWLSSQPAQALTGWVVARALSHVAVAVAAGVALSAVFLAVAPEYAVLRPFAASPRWALSGCIAAVIHRVAPWVVDFAQARFGLPGSVK